MKIIQLKNCSIGIANCGACPFFEYDSMQAEYHTCKITVDGRKLAVDIKGIPIACPLEEKDRTVRFLGCEYEGTKFKGCDTWQL